jgi:hypothetical protein
MSSPKAAAAKAGPKRKPAIRSARKPASKPVSPKAANQRAAAKAQAKAAGLTGNVEASAAGVQLAATIERALADGRLDTLSLTAAQALMGALCKTYAAKIEAGEDVLPLGQRTSVTPTEVMVTASGLLRAANLAVFELGMWQSWTGR